MAASDHGPGNASSMRTSFLIPNLHCPTCVTRIHELMRNLDPPPLIQNISIVNHVVTVIHDRSISVAAISDQFNSAAYEVFDVILDPAFSEQVSSSPAQYGQFATAVDRWIPEHGEMPDSARAEHRMNCSMCAEYSSGENESKEMLDLVVVAAPDTPNYQSTFSIEGMTCSSCVSNATQALKSVPGVTSAEVALVSMSANVAFRTNDPENFIKKLADAVEDVGYAAELVELKPIHTDRRAKPKRKSNIDKWQSVYSVDGMSCSSCVANIAGSIEQLDFVERVDVNLVAHSCTILFTGRDNERLIPSAIEELGYTATKVQMSSLEEEERNNLRTESLQIHGMHCPQCPDRIVAALQILDVGIERKPDLDRPIITVSYFPDAPELTIRTIIGAISEVDKSFTVSVYHPQSIEERSRKMRSKERASILRRLLLSLVAAIPAFVLGIVYMNLVPDDNPGYMYLLERLHGVTRLDWATFVIATPIYFYGADYFHRRTIKEIYALWRPRSSVPILRRFYRFGSMNMLISLGTTIAYFSSLAQLITAASKPNPKSMSKSGHIYFDSVVFLTMFLLAGRLVEAYMKTRSDDAVAALGKLRPAEASLVLEDGDSKVAVDYIDVGDTVRVPQGSTPPCDGILLDAVAEFDESSLTGESKMIRKQKGDAIYSGTINKGSSISLKVTGPAGASLLDSIIQVVREGQAKRAPIERVADLLTAYFVPVVVLIAILTWLIWLTLGLSGAIPNSYLEGNEYGGWSFWSLQFAIAVFVIACPCGLGLAAPTALLVGGGMAAKRGILVKGGGEGFQEASYLDAVIFDKTGTLTEGTQPKIVEHNFFGSSLSKSTILGALKAMEETSNHPLAKAAVTFATELSAASVRLTAADEIAGKGLKALFTDPVDGSEYETIVGNESLVQDNGVIIPREATNTLESWKSSGYSVILLAIKFSEKWHLMATFAAADPLRKEAAEVVRALQSQRVAVWMLSGDNPKTAEAVGSKVGIPTENIIAGVLPTEKADKVKNLQSSLKGRGGILSSLMNRRNRATIAMVGDGINDAPALAAADVGIAVASGSDVAIQSAAFVLVHSDLRAVLTLVVLSRAVFRRVIQNFFWAAIYNIIALPIAAGVLYPITSRGTHVRLDPAWAALAMAMSSITVVGSSLLLRTRLPFVGFRSDLK